MHQTPYKTQGFCWAQKTAAQPEHGDPEIVGTPYKNKQTAQRWLVTAAILLLHPPAGHTWICKRTLIKPTETSFTRERSMRGPVCNNAPTEQKHGETK